MAVWLQIVAGLSRCCGGARRGARRELQWSLRGL